MQLITRKGNFDSAHRVMNEKMKCFLIHGHTYLYSLTFSFDSMERIGYAIDFKEIKRVYQQWVDDYLDHGAILNPKDEIFIKAVKDLEGKIWLMSLNGEGEYCNPSVENIAKEVFLAVEILTENYLLLKIHEVEIFETPNCSTKCYENSINKIERQNFRNSNYLKIKKYSLEKGVLNYDSSKV